MSDLIANATACTQPVSVLHPVNLRSYLEGVNGLIVSLTYKKLDGTTRVLTGRLGVTAPLKGGANNVESRAAPYLTMFDFAKRAYRTVNLATVSEVRSCGRRYAVQ